MHSIFKEHYFRVLKRNLGVYLGASEDLEDPRLR